MKLHDGGRDGDIDGDVDGDCDSASLGAAPPHPDWSKNVVAPKGTPSAMRSMEQAPAAAPDGGDQ